jgi:hypothetical protein
MAKKTSKKKSAKKKPAKKPAKKAAKKKVRALVAAEERVTGLKYAVLAAEYAMKAHKELRTAPKKCTNAIARARRDLQKAIRACS